jgi:hypothetical protein
MCVVVAAASRREPCGRDVGDALLRCPALFSSALGDCACLHLPRCPPKRAAIARSNHITSHHFAQSRCVACSRGSRFWLASSSCSPRPLRRTLLLQHVPWKQLRGTASNGGGGTRAPAPAAAAARRQLRRALGPRLAVNIDPWAPLGSAPPARPRRDGRAGGPRHRPGRQGAAGRALRARDAALPGHDHNVHGAAGELPRPAGAPRPGAGGRPGRQPAAAPQRAPRPPRCASAAQPCPDAPAQVRTSQLDKEAAELRDEAAHLQQMQASLDGASAQAFRQQVRRDPPPPPSSSPAAAQAAASPGPPRPRLPLRRRSRCSSSWRRRARRCPRRTATRQARCRSWWQPPGSWRRSRTRWRR